MWGTPTDLRVLGGSAKRCHTIRHLETLGEILVSQGIELRSNGTKGTEQHDDLAGKATLHVTPLKNRRFLWRFPKETITSLAKGHVAVRIGRYSLPSQVSRPPHLIIGASRNFAVYSEEYLAVPARQIGIASPAGHSGLLRALALYLNSDFVAYQQFFTTTQAGIQKTIGTLKSLRGLPVPFTASSDLSAWESLYRRIADECGDRDDFDVPDLVKALNDLTFESLKLSARGRAAVHDLVHVRFGLTRGKRGSQATGKPTRDDCMAYARMLRNELDGFLNGAAKVHHQVKVLSGDSSGLVAIQIVPHTGKLVDIDVLAASSAQAKLLREVRDTLVERRAQWWYFDRNLRIYDGPNTYLLKPFQRLHWTRTQAIADAREIIADSLATHQRASDGEAIV